MKYGDRVKEGFRRLFSNTTPKMKIPEGIRNHAGCKIHLYASGYKWECPSCGKLNTMETLPQVAVISCCHCPASFGVKDIHHAWS